MKEALALEQKKKMDPAIAVYLLVRIESDSLLPEDKKRKFIQEIARVTKGGNSAIQAEISKRTGGSES